MDVNPKMLDKIHKDELEKLSLLSVGKPVWWERVACRVSTPWRFSSHESLASLPRGRSTMRSTFN